MNLNFYLAVERLINLIKNCHKSSIILKLISSLINVALYNNSPLRPT